MIRRGFAIESLHAAMIMATERSDKSLPDLVDELHTPGGITQHGLESLDAHDVVQAWRDACSSVLERLSKPY